MTWLRRDNAIGVLECLIGSRWAVTLSRLIQSIGRKIQSRPNQSEMHTWRSLSDRLKSVSKMCRYRSDWRKSKGPFHSTSLISRTESTRWPVKYSAQASVAHTRAIKVRQRTTRVSKRTMRSISIESKVLRQLYLSKTAKAKHWGSKRDLTGRTHWHSICPHKI